MLRRIFGRKRESLQSTRAARPSYREQKALVQHRDVAVRRALASREDLRPEILYYLAEDSSADVRRAIAGNASAPAQADLRLARDVDDEVRADLARKIGRLIPDMPEDVRLQVRELTLQTLEMLARDQLPRVRAILAEEIKHTAKVPHHIVRLLAADVESIVAAPVLEYSPLLSDADLLEVIAAGTAQQALTAIARRHAVSADVADAVVATLDVPAVAALLANKSAQIREDTLDQIIGNAAEVETWHQPLVLRPELSLRAVRRIAGFVASSLVDILAERHDLDADTAALLSGRTRERINAAGGPEEETEAASARRLAAAGALDDEALDEALAAGRRDFLLHALSALSGLPAATVEKVLRMRSAKAVTAVAWKAGLSMRLAVQLQARLAFVPPAQMLHARNGVDFPLTPEEMTWQLDALR